MDLLNKKSVTPIFDFHEGDLTHTFVIGSSGQGMSFNPVAYFAKDADFVMKFLQQASSFELDTENLGLAKQIGEQVATVKLPTVFELVEAWRTEPALIKFVDAVAQAMLPN